MHERRDDEHIGYGKPPKRYQYKKGQSGNPKGRPRKKPKQEVITDSVADDILRAELNRKVKVTERGRSREITAQELVVRAQVQNAAKGNAMAQRDILLAARALELRDQERRLANEARRLERYKSGIRFKAAQQKLWDEAAKRGVQEPDDPWPHPDDILIDHDKQSWTVRGPLNEKDVPLFELVAAIRELYFLQDMIWLRTCKISRVSETSIFEMAWRHFDSKLPLDWQIAPEISSFRLSAFMMPLRDLRCAEKEMSALVNALEPPEWKVWDPKTYRIVNRIMKPLLKKLGYQSLAHMEREYASQ